MNVRMIPPAAALLCALSLIAGCPAEPEKLPKGMILAVLPTLAVEIVLDADQSNWESLETQTLLDAAQQTDNPMMALVVEALVRKNRKCEAVNFIRSHFLVEPIVCPDDLSGAP